MEDPRIAQEIEDQREKIQHRDVVLHARAVLATVSGRELFKYFFNQFGVGQFPKEGLIESQLRDELGSLRAGNAFFKLASEADFEIAAKLLAQLEKDRYDLLYAQTNNVSG